MSTNREKLTKDLAIRQARKFEELKNQFYETNYIIQNMEKSATDPLTSLNILFKMLIEFEKGMLELKEILQNQEE